MVGMVARVGDCISVGSLSRVVGITASICDRVPMSDFFRGRCPCLRSRMRRIVGIAGLTCHLGRVVGMVASVIICVRGESGLV